jgi:hypothetical protein
MECIKRIFDAAILRIDHGNGAESGGLSKAACF